MHLHRDERDKGLPNAFSVSVGLAPLVRKGITHHHKTDHVLDCFDLSLDVTGEPPTSVRDDEIVDEPCVESMGVVLGSACLSSSGRAVPARRS